MELAPRGDDFDQFVRETLAPWADPSNPGMHRSPSIDYDIQFAGGVKTMLFGGEGLFYAVLRGPGRVWLQSLPFSRLASRIYAAAPQTGHGGREVGSVLGRLGNLLDGNQQ